MNIMNTEIIKIDALFDTDKTIAHKIFEGKTYPWEVLPFIGNFIIELGKMLDHSLYTEIRENVWVAKDAEIFESAYIKGPCIIDCGTEVRHCAFIRGNVIVGKNCVVGNSTEVKNSIIFDNTQIPHYNYVGDSVLGYHSHLGAGSITSNVKSDHSNVIVRLNGKRISTGLRKMGAMVGDYVEIGCGSVLNPGTIVGKNSNVYPLSSVRGYVAENSIYKNKNEIVEKEDTTKD